MTIQMRFFSVCFFLMLLTVCASAQTGSSRITGTVTDPQGAVIPGANVVVKNTGTNAQYDAVTGSDGGFTVASLPGGVYSVTVSLMGFKTAVLNSVTLQAAVPATVKVTMQVGALEENVTVIGDSALIVQTQTPAIPSTPPRPSRASPP